MSGRQLAASHVTALTATAADARAPSDAQVIGAGRPRRPTTGNHRNSSRGGPPTTDTGSTSSSHSSWAKSNAFDSA
jgi:hypothetical protein